MSFHKLIVSGTCCVSIVANAQEATIAPQTNDPSGFAARSARQVAPDVAGIGHVRDGASLRTPGSERKVGKDQVVAVKGFIFSRLDTRSPWKEGEMLTREVSAALESFSRSHLHASPQGDFLVRVPLSTLDDLALYLSDKYRDITGVVAPVVVLGAQDITEGVITFLVIEGRLEQASVSGVDATGSSLSQKRLQYANDVLEEQVTSMKGNVLLSKDFERAVMILQDLTGSRYSVQLKAGETPQGVSGSLISSGVPAAPGFQASIKVDNQGSPTLGQHQFATSLFWRPSQTVMADQLFLNYVTSETANLSALALGYDLPLGATGLRGGLRVSAVDYALGGAYASANATGNARSASAYLTFPFIRSQSTSLDSTLTFSKVELEDSNSSSSNPRSLSCASGELRAAWNDGLRSQTSFVLGATVGDLSFDTPAQSTADTLVLEGGSLLFFYELSHAYRLGETGDITTMFRGQSARSNLDSYQKMSVGGVNGVRAFAPTEANGDDAYLARVELGHSFSMWGSENRLALFYDEARVSVSHAPPAGTPNVVKLAGYGAQWQCRTESGISSRFYWAMPTGNSTNVRSSVDGRSSRLGYDLSYSF